MADDLSVDSVLEFLAARGGKVKNSVLVPHFKKFFNNPQTKDQDRQKFKEIVNTVATVKVENGEKFIYLKKKYRTSSSAKSSKSEEDETTTMAEEEPTTQQPIPADDLNTPQGGVASSSVAESKGEASSSVAAADEARVSGSYDTNSMTSSVNDEPPKPSEEAKEAVVNSSGGDDVIFAKPLPPPAARENTSEKTSSSSSTPVEAPGSGSLGRRNKTKKPAESPNMSERHSARVGRIKNASAASPSAALQSSEGGRRNRPMSIYQGSLPGSFERVRQNFVNKPKNLEDSKKQNSLTNSQASLSSKEIDQDEDYDRNSPAFVLDANDKQWILSACRGDLVEMRKLLDEDETLADKKDFIMGYTALHWAAKKGNRDMAQILIEMSVQLSPKSNGGYTPLHLAAMNGHEEIVTLLLDSGADPNVRDFSGRQPIHYLKSIALPLKSKSQQLQRVNCSNAPKWKFHAFSGTAHVRARSDKLYLKLSEHTRAFATDQRHALSSASLSFGGQTGRRRRGSLISSGGPDRSDLSRSRVGSFNVPPVESNVKMGPDMHTQSSHKVSRTESIFGFIRRNSQRGGKSSRSSHMHHDDRKRQVRHSPKIQRSAAGAAAPSSGSTTPRQHQQVETAAKEIERKTAKEAKSQPPMPASGHGEKARANVIKAAPASRFMWKPTSK